MIKKEVNVMVVGYQYKSAISWSTVIATVEGEDRINLSSLENDGS
jgi:hypothetical protein